MSLTDVRNGSRKVNVRRPELTILMVGEVEAIDSLPFDGERIVLVLTSTVRLFFRRLEDLVWMTLIEVRGIWRH